MILQTFSSEMYQLGEEHHLGAPVGIYQRYITLSGKIVVAGMLLLLLGIIGMIVFLFSSSLGADHFPGDLISSLPGFGQGIFALGMFLAMLRHEDPITPLHPKLFVIVYSEGLIFHKGRGTQVVHWEQITSIQRQFSVQRRKGRIKRMQPGYLCLVAEQPMLVLSTAISGVDEIGAIIERELTRRLLPQMLLDYQAGKPIRFPWFTLSQRTIRYYGQDVSWEQVSQIKVTPDKLMITKDDKQAKGPLSDIPNVCVVEALLDDIRQEKGFELILEPGRSIQNIGAIDALPLYEKQYIQLTRKTTWISTVMLVLLVLLMVGVEIVSNIASFQHIQ